MAPEIYDRNYGSKCDIWSIGVIAFILLTGQVPFKGNDFNVMLKVRRANYNFKHPAWNGISDKCKDFISKLLTLDPNDRPSAEEALKHPWLDDANLSGKASVEQNIASTSL